MIFSSPCGVLSSLCVRRRSPCGVLSSLCVRRRLRL